MQKEKKPVDDPRLPKLYEAILTFGVLVVTMAIGIVKFDVDPHVPLFIGVVFAALMALKIGYNWSQIETAMMDGIYRALQAVIILVIIGILVGVWIASGVVPTMIYYGLKLLTPGAFLIASLFISSITSLATGTSWGTMGTMGIALMGIATGFGIPAPAAAGAIISGAYFGDKMSPLSDTTNLAPAMSGTDVFTHIKFMFGPTIATYIICIIFFGLLGMGYAADTSTADIAAIATISEGISQSFVVHPLLLLPPLIVIIAVARKVPAIPGITIGIFAGGILGVLIQGDAINLGILLDAGMNGFTSHTGVVAVDELLTNGGLMNMMYSISLTILAMMFGGIVEATHQLEVIVDRLLKMVRGPVSLIALTEATCVVSNATMPEQYISIVIPGRMYAETYRTMGLHPKTLSNALESAGTVTSALIPWNTCGVFILTTLGVRTAEYLPFAMFNYLMPLMTIALAVVGITLADKDGNRITKHADRRAMREAFKAIRSES